LSSLYSFFESKFDVEAGNSYDPNQIKICCPFCEGSLKDNGSTRSRDTEFKCYVHLGKQMYYCQRCGAKGGLKSFFKKVWNVDPKEMGIYIENTTVATGEDLQSIVLKAIFSTPAEKTRVELPKEYRDLNVREALSGRTIGKAELLAYDYVLNRGLEEDEVAYYRLGFCSEGYYKDRLIIPVVEKGEVVYFTNRIYMWKGSRLTPEVERQLKAIGIRKTINPSKEKDPNLLGKSDVVFNLDSIQSGGQVVITEGPFDAMRVGTDAVAILGSTMSKTQMTKIMKKRPSKVIVMLDGDAWDKAQAIAKAFEGLANVHIARIGEADPGDMERSESRAYIESAEKYVSGKVSFL